MPHPIGQGWWRGGYVGVCGSAAGVRRVASSELHPTYQGMIPRTACEAGFGTLCVLASNFMDDSVEGKRGWRGQKEHRLHVARRSLRFCASQHVLYSGVPGMTQRIQSEQIERIRFRISQPWITRNPRPETACLRCVYTEPVFPCWFRLQCGTWRRRHHHTAVDPNDSRS